MPKKNKSAVLLFTQHHHASVDPATSKPKIVLAYNDTKGGIATLEHLIANYTCARSTLKWTTNVFFFLLDVAAHNSFALYAETNPSAVQTNRQRRLHLQLLSKSLIEVAIKKRLIQWRSNNAQDIPSYLVNAAVDRGYFQKSPPIVSSQQVGRCYLCIDRRRTRTQCSSCHQNI